MDEKKYVRYCPQCGKELNYSCKSALNLAIKKSTTCVECRIKNSYDKKKYKNNVKVLLNEELETYYWIGFILSDGHIENGKRLKIMLKESDHEHLEKLNNYIKGNLGTQTIKIKERCFTNSSLTVQDAKYIPLICEKFDLKSNKTKNPPSLKIFNKMEDDKLMALIIGFIDGDGCIRKQTNRNDFYLTIKNDESWIEILRLFNIKIDNSDGTSINKNGYSKFSVTNTVNLKALKKFAIDNNLPILKRKWDIIDLNYVGKYEVADIRKQKVKQLYVEGKTINEICKVLELKYDTVYGIILRNNFKSIKHE